MTTRDRRAAVRFFYHSHRLVRVGEIELSHMDKKHRNPNLVCENIRIYHECEDEIEKSVARITDCHHEACRSMTNSYRQGRIYLSNPHKNNGYIFLVHH